MIIKYFLHRDEYEKEIDIDTEEGKTFLNLLKIYDYDFNRLYFISEEEPYKCYDLKLSIIGVRDK